MICSLHPDDKAPAATGVCGDVIGWCGLVVFIIIRLTAQTQITEQC